MSGKVYNQSHILVIHKYIRDLANMLYVQEYLTMEY
jgi:hypothetical protein